MVLLKKLLEFDAWNSFAAALKRAGNRRRLLYSNGGMNGRAGWTNPNPSTRAAYGHARRSAIRPPPASHSVR